MAEKMAGQMNDHTFSGNDCMSVIEFPQGFKYTCDVSNIHEGASTVYDVSSSFWQAREGGHQGKGVVTQF